MSSTLVGDLIAQNPLFDVLATSKLSLKNSYRNPNNFFDFRCKFCHAIYSNSVPDAFSETINKQVIKPMHLFSCENCGRRYDPEDPETGVFIRAKQIRGKNIVGLNYPNNPYEETELPLFDFTQEPVIMENGRVKTEKVTTEDFSSFLDKDYLNQVANKTTLPMGVVLYNNPIFKVLKDNPYLNLDVSFRNRSNRASVQCKFCNALYQDQNKTAFDQSRSGYSALSSFLSCDNCGMRCDENSLFRRTYNSKFKPFPNTIYEDTEPELLELEEPEIPVEKTEKIKKTKTIETLVPTKTITLKKGSVYFVSSENTFIIVE